MSDTFDSDCQDQNPSQLRDEGREPRFVIAPLILLADARLSDGAKVLWMYLKSRAWFGDEVFPSQKRMCRDLNIGLDTVKRRVRELRDRGMIRIQCQPTSVGRINVYTLIDIFQVYGEKCRRSWEQLKDSDLTDVSVAGGGLDDSCADHPLNIATTPSGQKCPPNKTNRIELDESEKDEADSGRVAPASGGSFFESSPNAEGEIQEKEKGTHPLAAATAVFGERVQSPARDDGVVKRLWGGADKLRRDEKEREKKEKKQKKEERNRKAVEAAQGRPEGVSQQEWEEKTCGKKLWLVFKEEMAAAGYPTLTKPAMVDYAYFHRLWEWSGSLVAAIRVIEYVVRSWSAFKQKRKINCEFPWAGMFGSHAWMQSVIPEVVGGKNKITAEDEILARERDEVEAQLKQRYGVTD